MIELDAERIAAAAGADVVRRGRRQHPERVVVDSRDARRGRPLRRAARRAAWTGATSPGSRSPPGRGASSSRPIAPAASTSPTTSRAGSSRRTSRSRGFRVSRASGGESSTARRRDHGLDRQDLGQGHRPRDPPPARPREPRELQHRDRPAARDPLRAARDRGDGAGDGDARHGPDRRALRDRRARRGRDHQHRARAPRAARHPRGDRRGEGRDPRVPRAARHRGDPRGRRGARSRTSTTSCARSASGPAATSSLTAPRSRAARRSRPSGPRTARATFAFPFTEAHNLSNALARSRSGWRSTLRSPRWSSGRRG